MIRSIIQLLACVFVFSQGILDSQAQSGSVMGFVFNGESGNPLDAAIIYLKGEGILEERISSTAGEFAFDDVPYGSYNVIVSHLGYRMDTVPVELNEQKRIANLDISMVDSELSLAQVEVRAEKYKATLATPASLRNLRSESVQKVPGSGSDIAKVIQILPGVTTTSSFRNDMIIRGGSPGENSFFIDGIRVPVINHLTTQGSSGGAISMLNIDFISNVSLNSGIFDAENSNALSSVFNFDLMDGDSERTHFRLSAGATNLSLDAYGPISENASFIASVRRSYRQYILKLIGLAVYPVYNDFLLKFKVKTSPNSELTLLGLGAIDKFRLNNDINDSEIQAYLLDNLPVSDQWNYTAGARHKWFTKNGVWDISASRSQLYNEAERESSTSLPEEYSLSYESNEITNRVASSYTYISSWGTIEVGAELTNRQSDFDVFNLAYLESGPNLSRFESSIDYLMYGAHAQLSFSPIPGVWKVDAGTRIDGTDYSSGLNNPLDYISPRLSTGIQITNNLKFNAGIAQYHQLPSDVTLGFSDGDSLVNSNTAEYIKCLQYIAGISYTLPWSANVSLEVFRKEYSDYPFNTRENISQANEGGEYGVAGNSPIVSTGSGRSQGIEVFYEQELFNNWYGSVSYTLSSSKFDNAAGDLTPSSWDARHILNAVVGRKLKRNWQLGCNVRYQSALPYTPFDPDLSSFVPVWNINQEGIRNFSMINAERGKSALLIDLRVDKQWNYKWGTLIFYVDIENLLSDADSQQVLVLDKTDEFGNPVENPVILNPNDPIDQQQYKLKEIQNAEGTLIPTFGFILEI